MEVTPLRPPPACFSQLDDMMMDDDGSSASAAQLQQRQQHQQDQTKALAAAARAAAASVEDDVYIGATQSDAEDAAASDIDSDCMDDDAFERYVARYGLDSSAGRSAAAAAGAGAQRASSISPAIAASTDGRSSASAVSSPVAHSDDDEEQRRRAVSVSPTYSLSSSPSYDNHAPQEDDASPLLLVEPQSPEPLDEDGLDGDGEAAVNADANASAAAGSAMDNDGWVPAFTQSSSASQQDLSQPNRIPIPKRTSSSSGGSSGAAASSAQAVVAASSQPVPSATRGPAAASSAAAAPARSASRTTSSFLTVPKPLVEDIEEYEEERHQMQMEEGDIEDIEEFTPSPPLGRPPLARTAPVTAPALAAPASVPVAAVPSAAPAARQSSFVNTPFKPPRPAKVAPPPDALVDLTESPPSSPSKDWADRFLINTNSAAAAAAAAAPFTVVRSGSMHTFTNALNNASAAQQAHQQQPAAASKPAAATSSLFSRLTPPMSAPRAAAPVASSAAAAAAAQEDADAVMRDLFDIPDSNTPLTAALLNENSRPPLARSSNAFLQPRPTPYTAPSSYTAPSASSSPWTVASKRAQPARSDAHAAASAERRKQEEDDAAFARSLVERERAAVSSAASAASAAGAPGPFHPSPSKRRKTGEQSSITNFLSASPTGDNASHGSSRPSSRPASTDPSDHSASRNASSHSYSRKPAFTKQDVAHSHSHSHSHSHGHKRKLTARDLERDDDDIEADRDDGGEAEYGEPDYGYPDELNSHSRSNSPAAHGRGHMANTASDLIPKTSKQLRRAMPSFVHYGGGAVAASSSSAAAATALKPRMQHSSKYKALKQSVRDSGLAKRVAQAPPLPGSAQAYAAAAIAAHPAPAPADDLEMSQIAVAPPPPLQSLTRWGDGSKQKKLDKETMRKIRHMTRREEKNKSVKVMQMSSAMTSAQRSANERQEAELRERRERAEKKKRETRRLQPSLDQLHTDILTWNLRDLGANGRVAAKLHAKLVSIPLQFRDPDEYQSIMYPLLLEECRAGIEGAIEEMRSANVAAREGTAPPIAAAAASAPQNRVDVTPVTAFFSPFKQSQTGNITLVETDVRLTSVDAPAAANASSAAAASSASAASSGGAAASSSRDYGRNGDRNAGYQHDDLVIIWQNSSSALKGGALFEDEEGELDPAVLATDWMHAPCAILALLQDFDNKNELNRNEALAASNAANIAAAAAATSNNQHASRANNPPFRLRLYFDNHDPHSSALKKVLLTRNNKWMMVKLQNIKTLHREYSALQSCDLLLLKDALLHPPTDAASAEAAAPTRAAAAGGAASSSSGSAINPASILAAVSRHLTLPLMLQQFPAHLSSFNDGQKRSIARALMKREGFSLIQGPPGTGKCWSRNTKLLLYSGETITARQVYRAMQRGQTVTLMGDDSTPRRTLPGTQTKGNTADDVLAPAVMMPIKAGHGPRGPRRGQFPDGKFECKYDGCDFRCSDSGRRHRHEQKGKAHTVMPATTDATYRVTSHNQGRQTWMCNGNHILVLKFNRRPSKVQQWPEHPSSVRQKPFYFTSFTCVDGVRDVDGTCNGGLVQDVSTSFATRQETEEAREDADAVWRPFVWQCTVNEFLRCSDSVKKWAQMFQPESVQFQQAPGQSLRHHLQRALQAVHEDAPGGVGIIDGQLARLTTPAMLSQTAWVLGMWLADGCAHDDSIDQIHSHTPIVKRLVEWYNAVMCVHGVVEKEQRKDGREGNPAYRISMGPVLRHLLGAYQLIKDKHFPHSLLSETPEVRTALLTGVLDGGGHADRNRGYEVAAKERRFIDGLVHLARGLGFSTGSVGQTTCTNEEGKACKGWRVFISGVDLPKIRTALPHKRFDASASDSANEDQRCDSFRIKRVSHRSYYGFQLDGNGRCLMGDFVVTHNTSTIVGMVNMLWMQFHAKLHLGGHPSAYKPPPLPGALVSRQVSNFSRSNLQRSSSAASKQFRLLLCAPSNAAINEIVDRLEDALADYDGNKVQLNIVRLGAGANKQRNNQPAGRGGPASLAHLPFHERVSLDNLVRAEMAAGDGGGAGSSAGASAGAASSGSDGALAAQLLSTPLAILRERAEKAVKEVRLLQEESNALHARIKELTVLHKEAEDEEEREALMRDAGQIPAAANTAVRKSVQYDEELRQLQAKIPRLLQQKNDQMKSANVLKAREFAEKRTALSPMDNMRCALLQRANIICTTLSGAGLEFFRNLNLSFSTVIVDESAQSSEIQTLIPLKYNVKRCILVGDPNQLSATVRSSVAVSFAYKQSLFERLQLSYPAGVELLNMQYRMHWEIARWPSKTFYEGRLQTAPELCSALLQSGHVSLQPAAVASASSSSASSSAAAAAGASSRSPKMDLRVAPYVLYDVAHGSESSGQRASLFNTAEADVAVQLFQFLRRQLAAQAPELYRSNPAVFIRRIGLISPYQRQVSELRRRFERVLNAEEMRSLEIDSVDSYQGREKDFIIFSCVRAQPPERAKQTIGFLSEFARLNVALTRARLGMFVLAHAATVSKDRTWAALVEDARERKRTIIVPRDPRQLFERSLWREPDLLREMEPCPWTKRELDAAGKHEDTTPPDEKMDDILAAGSSASAKRPTLAHSSTAAAAAAKRPVPAAASSAAAAGSGAPASKPATPSPAASLSVPATPPTSAAGAPLPPGILALATVTKKIAPKGESALFANEQRTGIKRPPVPMPLPPPSSSSAAASIGVMRPLGSKHAPPSSGPVMMPLRPAGGGAAAAAAAAKPSSSSLSSAPKQPVRPPFLSVAPSSTAAASSGIKSARSPIPIGRPIPIPRPSTAGSSSTPTSTAIGAGAVAPKRVVGPVPISSSAASAASAASAGSASSASAPKSQASSHAPAVAARRKPVREKEEGEVSGSSSSSDSDDTESEDELLLPASKAQGTAAPRAAGAPARPAAVAPKPPVAIAAAAAHRSTPPSSTSRPQGSSSSGGGSSSSNGHSSRHSSSSYNGSSHSGSSHRSSSHHDDDRSRDGSSSSRASGSRSSYSPSRSSHSSSHSSRSSSHSHFSSRR